MLPGWRALPAGWPEDWRDKAEALGAAFGWEPLAAYDLTMTQLLRWARRAAARAAPPLGE